MIRIGIEYLNLRFGVSIRSIESQQIATRCFAKTTIILAQIKTPEELFCGVLLGATGRSVPG